MGGAWEKPIRTVRKVLSGLDDKGLQMLLCEVGSIINGCLSTKVSDEPRDVAALTPNHVFLLKSDYCMPPGAFSKSDSYGNRDGNKPSTLQIFLEEMDQGVFTDIADTTKVAPCMA